MQLSARMIVGVVAFCVAGSGGITANLLITMMIGEINRKRQDGNLVSYFGFTFPKLVRIFEEYRRLYPNGGLHVYALVAIGALFVGMGIVVICLLSSA